MDDQVPLVMSTIAYGQLFFVAYLANKAVELSYIDRHSPQNTGLLDGARKMQNGGRFIERLFGRSLESMVKGTGKPETPTSKRLKQHWHAEDRLGWKFLLRECTTFPTFKGAYETLRGYV